MANYLSAGAAGRSSIALLMAAALIYMLGVEPNMLIQMLQLGTQDILRLFGRPAVVAEQKVQMSMVFVSCGTVISLLFMLVGVPIVGYITGVSALIAAVIVPRMQTKKHAGDST